MALRVSRLVEKLLRGQPSASGKRLVAGQFGTTLYRPCSSQIRKDGIVLGCGSNVVDSFYKVKALPRPGEKGFFQDPNRVLEAEYIGGVTLNHLCWAQLLGTPTGLMALQGEDHHGKLIRKELKKVGVETRFIEVKNDYTTSQSLVFVEEAGERSIIMAKGATSLINAAQAAKSFGPAIASAASIVSTEISQVPLSGVLEMLKIARANGVLSIVDLDVSPEVAVKEALLGSEEEFIAVCQHADVLKPARHAAEGLATLLCRTTPEDTIRQLSTEDLTLLLRRECSSQLVAMTDGLAPSCFVTADQTVNVAPVKLDRVVDATGAGDAFLGGLISAIHQLKGVPKTKEDLEWCGTIANRLGSACCEVLGAVPTSESRERVKDLINDSTSTATSSSGDRTGSATSVTTATQASLHVDIASLGWLSGLEGLPQQVSSITDKILNCKGNRIVSGVGKSGLVGNRMAATLSSLSVACEYIHSGELLHGDLGKVSEASVAVLISHSGRTAETLTACEHLQARGVTVLAIVSDKESPIAKLLGEGNVLAYGHLPFQEPAGGVPTISLVVQNAIVNCIANTIMEKVNFDPIKFGVNHPGGALGASLPRG